MRWYPDLAPYGKKKAAAECARQSRTELLKTAVVDRAIRAPSNESNRETGPTPEIQVRHSDLADHGRLHAAPRRHRIVLPPGSDRRLLGAGVGSAVRTRTAR